MARQPSPSLAEVGNPVYSLIAKPQIHSFADLKGKLIGLSLPIDTISISTRRLLALKGVNDGDYRVKELVGSPARAACLKNGECDAVPLGQPDDLVAVKDGLSAARRHHAKPWHRSHFDVIAARRDFAESHMPAVIGFVAALADACRFIRDPARRAEVTKAVVELTGVSDDIARAILALYLDPDRGVVPKQAEIDLNGLGSGDRFHGGGRHDQATVALAGAFRGFELSACSGSEIA